MSSQVFARCVLILTGLVGLMALENAFVSEASEGEELPVADSSPPSSPCCTDRQDPRFTGAGTGETLLAANFQPSSPSACTGHRQISWPAKNPVWTLCWIPPTASSGANVGRSGLELLNVRYKGKLVLWRAHTPILNVRYHEPYYPSCGPHYRDWQYELAPFDPRGEVKAPGYALVKTYPPITTLDHPGKDAGTFKGVAVFRGQNFLSLTTQTKAGWYRYVQEWRFHPNGVIEPRYGFSAVNNVCVGKAHDHHVYWRFDFDIEDAADDIVEEYRPKEKRWVHLLVESRCTVQPGERWRVRDKVTKRGYELIPGPNDQRVQDAFSVGDLWALRCHENSPGQLKELTDGGIPYNMPGGTTGTANAKAQINRLLNKESIDGKDVVLWYRACTRHVGAIHKVFVGPQLRPVNW